MLQNFFGYLVRAGRIILLDRAADPTANGQIQRNGAHVKVYSGGAVRSLSDIATAANEFNDDVFRVRDQTDATKKIALEASGIATATTRTITMPDRDVNLGSAAPAASAVADTATEGAAATLARSDHRHGREAFGGAGYPVDVEATEADGVATTLARSDHQHKLGIMTTRGDLVRRGAAAAERLALGAAGQQLTSDGADALWRDDAVAINFIIDGGGSAITTGQKGHVELPFAMTITGWTILADVSGSIVVDVWKDSYANFPPTVADTIAGTEKPTLSAVQKNQDLSLTSWTTAVAAGDILAFNVDSAATVTRVVVAIRGTKA